MIKLLLKSLVSARLIPTLLLLACGLPAQSGETNGDAPIKQFHELTALVAIKAGAKIAFGGATELTALPWLKEKGYKSVINLRAENERPGHIEQMRHQAGLNELHYTHLPFDPAVANNVAETFIQQVRTQSNHPLYIHCNSATRAAALWLIFRVLEDGLDFDDARREVEGIAGRPDAAITFAKNYLDKLE